MRERDSRDAGVSLRRSGWTLPTSVFLDAGGRLLVPPESWSASGRSRMMPWGNTAVPIVVGTRMNHDRRSVRTVHGNHLLGPASRGQELAWTRPAWWRATPVRRWSWMPGDGADRPSSSLLHVGQMEARSRALRLRLRSRSWLSPKSRKSWHYQRSHWRSSSSGCVLDPGTEDHRLTPSMTRLWTGGFRNYGKNAPRHRA
jgi:hypothetical protein